MKIMTSLYFGACHRRHALDLVAAYAAGLSNRVFTVFNDIEAEADAASEAYFNERINDLVGFGIPLEIDYEDIDYEGHAERVQEAARGHAENVYSDLDFVRRQIIALAISGLYHLWERLLKQFLVQERIREKASIHKADFKYLTELLLCCGWDIQAQDFYEDLHRLCLVASTVKHGDGTSCDKLVAVAPELFFDFGHPWMNDGRGADDLRLDAEHFEQFTRAVHAFFERFPERLPPEVWPHGPESRSVAQLVEHRSPNVLCGGQNRARVSLSEPTPPEPTFKQSEYNAWRCGQR
jgi:hypothetical protein